MQEERSLKEVDKVTEKSIILILLRLAWFAGFAIIYTTTPAYTELLFSKASVQKGKKFIIFFFSDFVQFSDKFSVLCSIFPKTHEI